MTGAVRLAVVGAGLIGRRHAEAIAAARGARLAAIVDPAPTGGEVATRHGVAWHLDLEDAIAAGGLDGVILATPNAAHVEGALACITAGLPLLVEKPLAPDLAGARAIVAAAEARGVPVAVGHHRRHNPVIAAARGMIAAGRLGRVVTVEASVCFRKPDAYFGTDWRRQPGGGPVFINLIHDIDLLQHLVGPVVEVRAMESNRVRGHAVEDTAVVLLRFEGGALGTVTVSDAAVAPWSWELTARENPAYPASGEECYRIAGTEAALSLPDLRLWRHEGPASWWEPISATRFPVPGGDPLVLQIEDLVRVIRDGTPPLATARDGLAAVAVVEAVKIAAASGGPAVPAHLANPLE